MFLSWWMMRCLVGGYMASSNGWLVTPWMWGCIWWDCSRMRSRKSTTGWRKGSTRWTCIKSSRWGSMSWLKKKKQKQKPEPLLALKMWQKNINPLPRLCRPFSAGGGGVALQKACEVTMLPVGTMEIQKPFFLNSLMFYWSTKASFHVNIRRTVSLKMGRFHFQHSSHTNKGKDSSSEWIYSCYCIFCNKSW